MWGSQLCKIQRPVLVHMESHGSSCATRHRFFVHRCLNISTFHLGIPYLMQPSRIKAKHHPPDFNLFQPLIDCAWADLLNRQQMNISRFREKSLPQKWLPHHQANSLSIACWALPQLGSWDNSISQLPSCGNSIWIPSATEFISLWPTSMLSHPADKHNNAERVWQKQGRPDKQPNSN